VDIELNEPKQTWITWRTLITDRGVRESANHVNIQFNSRNNALCEFEDGTAFMTFDLTRRNAYRDLGF
jgi:hypothetical protein